MKDEKVVGLLVGREDTFPRPLLETVDRKGAAHGVRAETWLLGGAVLDEPSRCSVIVDRISHEVPYYRAHLKGEVLKGTVVVTARSGGRPTRSTSSACSRGASASPRRGPWSCRTSPASPTSASGRCGTCATRSTGTGSSALEASSPSARLDGFVSAGVIRFVECNAESPAGMACNDELAAVFGSLPVMREFKRRWRVRTLPARRHQLAATLRSYGKRVPAKPRIAIVDRRGLPTLTEFETLQRYFEEQGLRRVICAPEDLEPRRDRLHASGERVHLVYRRVLTSELLPRPAVAKPLVDAHLKGAVIVVNSFRAKLLHKKMSLALLSDDRYARLHTPGQRAAIARHIPWTRKVREGHTTYAGRSSTSPTTSCARASGSC
ncbi:MAG: hypothetical protein FJ028_02255 [Chloroflexi bacterium]|nr:hypothetical protein [Chloroflexota bacterium]